MCEAVDDDTDGCESTTSLVYDAEPKEIYIVVNGYETGTGNFDLTISVTASALGLPVSQWY